MSGRKGWSTVALSDLLRLRRDGVTVERSGVYPNLGIYSFGRGVFAKPPIMGDATSAPKLYRVRSGQFIYSRLFAFEGAFALVPPEMDGWFVSNEYPTFDIDDVRAIRDFLRVAICRQPVWDDMRAQTVGMGHRRQRLHPDALLAYELELPAPEEQRRIVDALGAADDVVATAVTEAWAASTLLATARERFLSMLGTRLLNDLLSDVEAGRSPRAFDRRPTSDERGVLKVSAIRAGEFRPTEAKAVSDDVSFPAHAQIRDGDVLMSRANTRALVGATCRVRGSFPNLYLSDKTLRLVVDLDLVSPDFLVQSLAGQVARAHIEGAATGTSESMKNISQRSLLETEVPYIEGIDRQRQIASRLDAIQDTLRRAHQTAELGGTARVALATSLVSGERRVRSVTELTAA